MYAQTRIRDADAGLGTLLGEQKYERKDQCFDLYKYL